jgi:hypothetical protein
MALLSTVSAGRGAPVNPAAPAEPPDRRLTPAQLRQDLAVLHETFEKAHAGLYRYTPKASMDSAFDAVSTRLRSRDRRQWRDSRDCGTCGRSSSMRLS